MFKTIFKRNEGILDRIARVTLGLVFLPTGLFLLGGLQGSPLGLVFTGIGTLGLVTGVTGVCPLYIPFGFSTLAIENKLIDRCRSMMASRWAGSQPGAGWMCGPGPQSIEKPHTEQG